MASASSASNAAVYDWKNARTSSFSAFESILAPSGASIRHHGSRTRLQFVGGAFRKFSVLRKRSIGPDHFEHVFRLDLKIVAAAASADDRFGPCGLVDAILDHGLVDVDGDDLAEGHPGLRLLAISALELDDLGQLAFERDRAFGNPRHVDQLAGHGGEAGNSEFVDVAGDM